jgi:hypothetical protein
LFGTRQVSRRAIFAAGRQIGYASNAPEEIWV